MWDILDIWIFKFFDFGFLEFGMWIKVLDI